MRTARGASSPCCLPLLEASDPIDEVDDEPPVDKPPAADIVPAAVDIEDEDEPEALGGPSNCLRSLKFRIDLSKLCLRDRYDGVVEYFFFLFTK